MHTFKKRRDNARTWLADDFTVVHRHHVTAEVQSVPTPEPHMFAIFFVDNFLLMSERARVCWIWTFPLSNANGFLMLPDECTEYRNLVFFVFIREGHTSNLLPKGERGRFNMVSIFWNNPCSQQRESIHSVNRATAWIGPQCESVSVNRSTLWIGQRESN